MKELISNIVFCLEQDLEGNMWAGTLHGVTVIHDVVDIPSNSIDTENKTSKIIIFPNPGNGQFSVNFYKVPVGTVSRLVSQLCVLGAISPPADCEYTFSSEDLKEGTFTSPGYPEHYDQDIVCKYIFRGSKGERVQITVTDIDLTYLNGDPMDPYE